MTEDVSTLTKKVNKEIDLKIPLLVLKQQFWIILILTMLFGGVGYWLSTHQKAPQLYYQASTRILVYATKQSNYDMNTLLVMATDPTVMNKISQQIGGKRSPGQLAGEITPTNINKSQIISIQVTDSDPQMAAVIANDEITFFKQQVYNVTGFKNIVQLSSAQPNRAPINPPVSHHKWFYYGILGGLIIGIFIAFFRQSFDDTIRSDKELEHLLEIPTVGMISRMTRWNLTKKKSWLQRLKLQADPALKVKTPKRKSEETSKKKQQESSENVIENQKQVK